MQPASIRRVVWPLLLLAGSAAMLAAVVLRVDLAPRVESNFFFSTDDPQLRASEAVGERFPSRPQLVLRAAGEDVRSGAYLEAIQALTKALQELPGIASVQSLANGPAKPEDAFEGPFWKRLLVPEGERATNLIVSFREAGEGVPSEGATVRAVEAVVARSPLTVRMSGVPYVVELIRRYLRRDLRVFSGAAILVFGLVLGVLARSVRVVVGTLAACLTACGLTLGLLGIVEFHIGVLTANLVTIVFVLTLSHTVFLTANWRRVAARQGPGPAAVREAVRLTLPASLGCMTAAALGFASLLLASAKPLRELGTAGVVGALVAIVVAYLYYPPFLAGARPRGRAAKGEAEAGQARGGAFLGRPPRWAPALVTIALCLAAGTGAARLSTDPSLLSYFKAGSALREGLLAIDADGGSSPLSLVVREPGGGRLDEEEGIGKLEALHAALEEDPATGVVLSVAPLLEEARRAVPLAALLPARALLGFLEQPERDRIALAFLSADRLQAHFFLRMREAGREQPRQAVVARLLAEVREAGLLPEVAGGLYELQGKLSSLVARSLLEGLAGLLALFFGIGAVLSRSLRTALAMVASLALVPLFLLGVMGYLGLPLDFISSPAAQVAIGIGVDSMIQLTVAARRARREGLAAAAAWVRARAEMGRAVVDATVVLATGFGLFALSSFPPTQRFGLAVALGMLASAAAALLVLPVLAAGRRTLG